MKLVSLRCPNCDANINTEIGNRSTFFCPYCGSKIYVDDEVQRVEVNVNHTYRKIDEARIQESQRKLRKLELEERKSQREHQETKMTLFFALALVVLFVVIAGIAIFVEDVGEKQSIAQGKVQIGISSEDFVGKNYETVVKELEARGFTNIETFDLDDAGWLINRENTIKAVSVNGKTSFYSYDYFDLADKIIITYH